MITRKLPVGRWSSSPEPPSGRPVPPPNPGIEQENEALAALLADVVELSRTGAVYPGHLALIAEQAQGYACVRRALRGEQ